MAAAVLALFCLALYWPAAGFTFAALDDELYVRDTSLVKEGFAFPNAARAFTSVENGLWMPVTWLSLQLDASLWGMEPAGFHRTNILLFSAAAALLLLLLWRMTGRPGASALAAALFALHPLRVESVAWVVERKDVLSFLLLLLALAAYLAFLRGRRRHWYLALCALHALALMAKPLAVPFPFLLLVLDLWPLGRLPLGEGRRAFFSRSRSLVREKIPLFILSLAMAALTFVLFTPWKGDTDLAGQLERALVSPFIYLGKTLWPAGLGLEFFDPALYSFSFARLAAALLATAALTGACLLFLRSRPYLLAGWAWFLVALLPAGGLVPTGVQWISDRFTLLPHVGLLAALAWLGADLLPRALRRSVAAWTLVLLVLLPLAAFSRRQLFFWRDPVTLMERSVSLHPRDTRAQGMYAETLARRGDLEAAYERFRLALSLPQPRGLTLVYDQGVLFLLQGKTEEAVERFRLALQEEPKNGLFLHQLGTALYRLQRWDEARICFEEALRRLDSDSQRADAHQKLGYLFARRNNNEVAAAHFAAALDLEPDGKEVRFNLALALEKSGVGGEAAVQYREYLRRFPGDLPASLRLAGVLYALGQPGEAEEIYRAVTAAVPATAEGFFALSRLRAIAGRESDARDLHRMALSAPPLSAGIIEFIRENPPP